MNAARAYRDFRNHLQPFRDTQDQPPSLDWECKEAIMADFYQTGVVTTLHRLNPNGHERLEADLLRFSRHAPIGLVLPALFQEFERPAMQRIVN